MKELQIKKNERILYEYYKIALKSNAEKELPIDKSNNRTRKDE